MRLFIRNITLFSLIILTFFCLVMGVKYYITKNISFKESSDVRYLFLGASHPWHAIDDRMMQTGVNRSATSERYLFTYLRLKKILSENPQIDTVFIQCSSTDIWQHPDDKYFRESEMSKFLPLYYPYFGKEEWQIYYPHLRDVIPILIQKSVSPNQVFSGKIKTQMGTQAKDQENLLTMDRNIVLPDYLEGNEGNSINFKYLRKIIDLCKNKNVKLYGIYYPVYKPEYYYDQTYYYETIRNKFPDLEVLDYSHWEVPDSARYDAHHLNKFGAQLFTNEIKKRFNIR